jgi:YD repeat-containing protein
VPNSGYAPNGNLLFKTDARGITTNYLYDSMNRLLSKTYSNDVSGTPVSCYQYGLPPSPPPVPNSIGRLINAWTLSASKTNACSASAPATRYPANATGFMTMRSIGAYDSMGRITSELQYTLANSTPYKPQYSYDLAGNLAYSTDGVTPTKTPSVQLPSCSVQAPSWITPTLLNFANCYDGAGRLQTLASNWAITGTAQSLFSAPPSSASPSYAAFGGLTNAVFGNSGIALNRTYDNRLRIISENDLGSIVGAPTSGSATVTITGAEQSK